MNTDKIYTINDFLLNVINYGRAVGILVSFPSIYIPDEEKDFAFEKREEYLKFLKDTYKDIKFYIDNEIFTAGKVIDSMYKSAKDVLPTLDNVEWDIGNNTEKDVLNHIDMLKYTSYAIISMILTNIITKDEYPEENVKMFIELD